jgi:hypothetical protein
MWVPSPRDRLVVITDREGTRLFRSSFAPGVSPDVLTRSQVQNRTPDPVTALPRTVSTSSPRPSLPRYWTYDALRIVRPASETTYSFVCSSTWTA